MSRPEDIPQDVWDLALCYVEDAQYTPTEIVAVVSRAIMAAANQERRHCLMLAQDNRYLFDPHDYEARGWNNASEAISQLILKRWGQEDTATQSPDDGDADAIRNRGEG